MEHAEAARAAPVRFETHPSRYVHWQARDRAAGGAPGRWTSRKSGRCGRATRSSSTATTSASTSSWPTRSSGCASSIPRCGCVVITSGKDRVFCSGANIYMLGTLDPRLQGQLLQVHERDAALRSRTPRATVGPQVARRACNGACAGGGYELALACDEILLVDDGNSRREPARGAAARACCPAPAGSRAWSTSARCAATWPTCSRPRRGRQGQARGGVAAGRRGDPARRSSRRACRSGPRRSAAAVAARSGAGRRARRRSRPSYADDGRRAPLRQRSTIDAAARVATLTRARARGRRADDRRGDARSAAASCGRCARSASSTTRCSTCASTDPRSASSC